MNAERLVEQLLAAHEVYLNRHHCSAPIQEEIEAKFAKLRGATVQRVEAAAKRKAMIEDFLERADEVLSLKGD